MAFNAAEKRATRALLAISHARRGARAAPSTLATTLAARASAAASHIERRNFAAK
jgi:hypothetical protein